MGLERRDSGVGRSRYDPDKHGLNVAAVVGLSNDYDILSDGKIASRSGLTKISYGSIGPDMDDFFKVVLSFDHDYRETGRDDLANGAVRIEIILVIDERRQHGAGVIGALKK